MTTHERCWIPPRSPTIVGSAVETIVWSSAASSRTRTSAEKITRMRRCCSVMRRRPFPVVAVAQRLDRGLELRLGERPCHLRRRGSGPHPVEQDPQVTPPGVWSDLGGRLEDRRERPHRDREIGDREVVAQRPLLAGAVDQPLQQRQDLPAALCDDAAAARLAQEHCSQRQVPGLELEHLLEEAGQPRPGVLGSGRLLGQPDDLADVLGVDRLDQRVARRESGGRASRSRPRRGARSPRALPPGRARRRPRGPPRSGVTCF